MSNTVYTNPGKLKTALAHLPILDFTSSYTTLREALTAVHKQDMKPAVRLELLEPLYTSCCQLLATHGRIAGPGPGRGDQEGLRQKRLREIALLFTDLFRGAQAAASTMGDGTGGFLQRAQPIAGVWHLALCALSRNLLCGHLQYAARNDKIWRDFYDTMLAAEKLGHLDTPVSHLNARGETVPSTCARIFKHALLVALADPFNMASEVLWETDLQLMAWADGAKLKPFSRAGDLHGVFIVDPAQPGPPLRAEHLGKADPLGAYLLDCSALIATVEKHLKLVEADAPLPKECLLTVGTARRLLPQLAALLKAPRARRGIRQRVEGSKEVAFGAAAAHYYIGGMRPFGHSGGTTPPPLAGISVDDGYGEYEEQEEEKPQQAAAPEYPLESWGVYDISAGGFCLFSPDLIDQSILIGDLLVICLPERGGAAPTYALGVVRWQMRQPRLIRKLGIEVLSRKVRAGAARAQTGTVGETTPRRAFLLDQAPEEGSVAVAGKIFKPQRGLCLEVADEWVNARGRALLEATDFFERFTVGDEAPDLASTRPLGRA